MAGTNENPLRENGLSKKPRGNPGGKEITMEEIELKPCPFCGGAAKLILHNSIGGVRCPECGVLGACFMDKFTQGDGLQKAVEAWNRRADNG